MGNISLLNSFNICNPYNECGLQIFYKFFLSHYVQMYLFCIKRFYEYTGFFSL